METKRHSDGAVSSKMIREKCYQYGYIAKRPAILLWGLFTVMYIGLPLILIYFFDGKSNCFFCFDAGTQSFNIPWVWLSLSVMFFIAHNKTRKIIFDITINQDGINITNCNESKFFTWSEISSIYEIGGGHDMFSETVGAYRVMKSMANGFILVTLSGFKFPIWSTIQGYHSLRQIINQKKSIDV